MVFIDIQKKTNLKIVVDAFFQRLYGTKKYADSEYYIIPMRTQSVRLPATQASEPGYQFVDKNQFV